MIYPVLIHVQDKNGGVRIVPCRDGEHAHDFVSTISPVIRAFMFIHDKGEYVEVLLMDAYNVEA